MVCIAACSGRDAADCIIPPCALPVAVEVAVTSSGAGGPVPGAFVTASGAMSGQGFCRQGAATTCDVMGAVGTYELDVGAPGYQTVHRQVVVAGTTPACGCTSVDTQRITLALVPAT